MKKMVNINLQLGKGFLLTLSAYSLLGADLDDFGVLNEIKVNMFVIALGLGK